MPVPEPCITTDCDHEGDTEIAISTPNENGEPLKGLICEDCLSNLLALLRGEVVY